jgi:hypothetical protein
MLIYETDKWDCIKLKSFCTSKETVTRVKRQNGRMGESFHSKTESLIQKIIQNIQRAQELNSKTTKNPIHKWANE